MQTQQLVDSLRAKVSSLLDASSPTSNVLDGTAFVLALPDGTMAVARDDVRPGFRLYPVFADRGGISHWSKQDAESVAAMWNKAAPASCQVTAMHWRDALLRQAQSLESVIERLVEVAA